MPPEGGAARDISSSIRRGRVKRNLVVPPFVPSSPRAPALQTRGAQSWHDGSHPAPSPGIGAQLHHPPAPAQPPTAIQQPGSLTLFIYFLFFFFLVVFVGFFEVPYKKKSSYSNKYWVYISKHQQKEQRALLLVMDSSGGQVIPYCIYLETKTSHSSHVLSKHKASTGTLGGVWSPPKSRDMEGQSPTCALGSRDSHVAPMGHGCVARLGDMGVTSSKAQPETRPGSERAKAAKDKSQRADAGGALGWASTPGRAGESCCSESQVKHHQGKAALGKGIFLLVVHRT